MLVLFSDTDCEVTPAIAAEYGCKVISMPYSIDGETIYPYEDFDEFDYKTYYDSLRNGTLPTTSAVSMEKYIEYFEPIFANGDDILYVHFSVKMSTTFNNMNKALEILKEKYPERKFYTIDTKGVTVLGLIIFREIAEMYKAGKSLPEIKRWADAEIGKFTMYLFADDLKFFKRSGRVGGLAATMGTLLGIRPIIYINDEGQMVSIGKEKGRQKAIDRLLAYVDELGEDVTEHEVIIAHSDAEDIVEEIKSRLIEKFGEDLKIEIVMVNPTTGAHAGPSAAGIAFHSIHR